jgi:glycosyltransferase involved in cell wall biosynthesis
MLSTVVSWRDRPDFARVLASMGEAMRHIGGDLTVVNYGGNDSKLSEIIERSRAHDVRVVRVADRKYFNKSRAQNIGAAASRHSLLFFCDCDIQLDGETLLALMREVEGDPQTFGTIAGVVESERNSRQARNVVCFGYELNIRIANGRTLRIIDNEEDVANGTRQAPGLLLVRRADFVRVGGYNGRLHGWGWEDQDMIARLTLAAELQRVQRGIVTHLSHGDAERTAHYPPVSSRWESRDRMFRQALAFYDEGDFMGTYLVDASDHSRSVEPERTGGSG